jgi:hypothetical protein
MKTSILLGLVIGLVAAEASLAQPGKPVRHTVHHAHRKIAPAAQRFPVAPAHRYSALALQQARAAHRVPGAPSANNDTPPSDDPGWVKDKDHAGWGLNDGQNEAVLGAYRRPTGPQLPGPDITHEGHGAAGVAVSVKLGNPQ